VGFYLNPDPFSEASTDRAEEIFRESPALPQRRHAMQPSVSARETHGPVVFSKRLAGRGNKAEFVQPLLRLWKRKAFSMRTFWDVPFFFAKQGLVLRFKHSTSPSFYITHPGKLGIYRRKPSIRVLVAPQIMELNSL
jgi:hypothetical protein